MIKKSLAREKINSRIKAFRKIGILVKALLLPILDFLASFWLANSF